MSEKRTDYRQQPVPSTNTQKLSLCANRLTHLSVVEALVQNKCHTYLVVLETGGLSGLGEATELGLVEDAEAGLGAGGQGRRGEERGGKKTGM